VLFLADVFESFRKVSLANYGLEPLYYYSAPGLSLDAMLKKTSVKLELFTEPEQLMFVERGIRGGVATIINRHSKGNNPYDPENYNADKASKYIMHLDASNLYGWAMSQPLPICNFRFLTPVELETFLPELYTKTTDARLGYILKVDLDYPDKLHHLHNDYPFAFEHFGIPSEML